MTDEQLAVRFAEFLGWKQHYGAKGYYGGECYWWWLDASGYFMCKMEDWHPCTDLNQAWLGVEKLQEQGWVYLLTPRYRNHWMRLFKEGKLAEAQEGHPARAIVEAILKAARRLEE